jgi:rhodanese-related sulfurtransferase
MKTLTAEQLAKMQRNDDVLLVNTLDEEYFEKTQIPGAKNIPQSSGDFVDRVEQQADSKDAKVVVYCANAQCDSSTQAAKKLEQAGFTNVYDFDTGAAGWQESQAATAR